MTRKIKCHQPYCRIPPRYKVTYHAVRDVVWYYCILDMPTKAVFDKERREYHIEIDIEDYKPDNSEAQA